MIKVEKLNKYYDYKKDTQFHALKDVDLTIENGEIVAIIGASGSGKSTLLHVLAGIDDFQAGSVMVDDTELSGLKSLSLAKYRNKKVGIVLQDFALIEGYSIIETVMIPLRITKGLSRAKMKEMALEALKVVGLEEIAYKMTNKLSGGQKQRVAIARAIVNDPQYLIADEPTGALDSVNSKQIMDLFLELNKLGKTVIIVTHDMEIASQCERMIKIEDGMIA